MTANSKVSGSKFKSHNVNFSKSLRCLLQVHVTLYLKTAQTTNVDQKTEMKASTLNKCVQVHLTVGQVLKLGPEKVDEFHYLVVIYFSREIITNTNVEKFTQFHVI